MQFAIRSITLVDIRLKMHSFVKKQTCDLTALETLEEKRLCSQVSTIHVIENPLYQMVKMCTRVKNIGKQVEKRHNCADMKRRANEKEH